MTDLVQLPEQIRHEFKVDNKGEIIASVRGTARLAEKKHTSLTTAFKSSGSQKPSSLAQFLAEYGFNSGVQNSWIENGVPGAAVNRILLYYAYECQPRYRSEQAKKLCDAFQKYGFDRWFQQQLGWQPETKPEKPLSLVEMFSLQAKINEENAKKLNEHDEAIDYLGNLYNLVAHNINVTNQSRLDVLMQVHESDLLANEDPSDVPLRKQVWKLVNKFSLAANILPENAWNYFYKELKDRYGFDAKARRKNRGLKFALDAVEQEPGMLENLHKIVSSEFKKLDLPKPQKVEDISNLSYIGQEQDLVLISPSEAKVGDSYDGKNFYRSPDKISK